MPYDKNNIFAKILRGEIPCDKVYESDYALAFKDINPQAKIHILVIPKGPYLNVDDFSNNAPDKEIIGLMKAVTEVCKISKVSEEFGGKGFRCITNAGPDGFQEVLHFHFHIMGGENLGLRGLKKDE
jgi:histidine triad (HIT) family protein